MADPLMYAPHAPGAPPFPINEEQVVQECIDCITDWVTRYIGERAMWYEHSNNRIYGESSPIKTIRDMITFQINEMVKRCKRYGSNEEIRSSYKSLLDTYHSLDYDVMTQQWQQYVIRDRARSTATGRPVNNMESYERYDYGRQGSIFDTFKSNIVRDSCHRTPGGPGETYGIYRFLNLNSSHGTKINWGRDNDNLNNVIRQYIKCYLDLYLALFPEYVNIQPEFIGNHYGGSKRKNKNKKTKKRKNKKNKSKRPRRY